MSIDDKLKQILIAHEGLRLKPYRCSAGKLTVGVGRNLDDVGISHEEAMVLLDNDIAKTKDQVERTFSWFKGLDEARQLVVLNMVFNLGMTRFLDFNQTIVAIKNRDYPLAAKHMLNSLWAKQVGKRAVQLSQIMETGKLDSEFH